LTVATERSDERVTPDDIRNKVHEIEGSMQETAQEAAPMGIAVGIGAFFLALIIAFLLGRRAGRRRSTVVEIRRI
jgi:hypothetical protein